MSEFMSYAKDTITHAWAERADDHLRSGRSGIALTPGKEQRVRGSYSRKVEVGERRVEVESAGRGIQRPRSR